MKTTLQIMVGEMTSHLGKGRSESGFTLMELLLIIAIIAMLSASLIAAGGKIIVRARIQEAKDNISQLITAMEAYASDYGAYPPDDNNDNMCTELTQALLSGAQGLYYISLREEDTSGGAFLDPWKNPYRYELGSVSTDAPTGASGTWDRGHRYWIWSCGPNGNNDQGAGDDVTSWK